MFLDNVYLVPLELILVIELFLVMIAQKDLGVILEQLLVNSVLLDISLIQILEIVFLVQLILSLEIERLFVLLVLMDHILQKDQLNVLSV